MTTDLKNRNQRRSAAKIARCRGKLRIAAKVISADDTVSGITLIQPDGQIGFLDADLIGRGGRA